LKGATRFLKILSWGFFIGFVLLLLSSSSGERPAWNCAGQLAVDITAPFQNFIKKNVDAVEGFWLNYFQLINVRQENANLMAEVDALKMENSRHRELLSTHERLQKLLQFKQTTSRPVLAAQVVGLDPTGWFKSVIINKGEEAGLGLNMPVVNANGVIGKIVSLSSNYAKVLLIIDQNSAVDCLVQRSRDRGMVKGLSAETCKLNYVVRSSDVAVGDMVVASGLGGVFPKGLPVGEILNVEDNPGKLFKDIEIRPAVDFSKLEEVLVILKEDETSTFRKKED
jgi:rod shape-determining protein MreC